MIVTIHTAGVTPVAIGFSESGQRLLKEWIRG